MARWALGALVVGTLAACSQEKDPEPSMVGGGSTEDFNGNLVDCSHSTRVPIGRGDDGARFAGMVRQVQSLLEGNYVAPVRWVTLDCGFDAGPSADDRELLPTALSELVGTGTVVHVGIHVTGKDATVWHDDNDDVFSSEEHSGARCAEKLKIPAVLRLTSDDGALDEELSLDIWSLDGRSAGAGGTYRPSAFRGSLSRQLPPDARVDLGASTWLNEDGAARFSFDIYASVGDAAPAIVKASLIDIDECHWGRGVPRDSVLK